MFLLLGFIENLWYKIYTFCFAGLSEQEKTKLATIFIVVSLLLFVFSTKGSKKDQVINSWFLFWIAVILAVLAVMYFTL